MNFVDSLWPFLILNPFWNLFSVHKILHLNQLTIHGVHVSLLRANPSDKQINGCCDCWCIPHLNSVGLSGLLHHWSRALEFTVRFRLFHQFFDAIQDQNENSSLSTYTPTHIARLLLSLICQISTSNASWYLIAVSIKETINWCLWH